MRQGDRRVKLLMAGVRLGQSSGWQLAFADEPLGPVQGRLFKVRPQRPLIHTLRSQVNRRLRISKSKRVKSPFELDGA